VPTRLYARDAARWRRRLAFLLAALAAMLVALSALGDVATVRVHERDVFVLRVPRAGQSPEERARGASAALESALAAPEEPEARVEDQGKNAVVYVGKTPVVTLTDDDAAAEGETTLQVYSRSVATRVQDALRIERKRSAIATTVFSFSLLVFSALVAFLLFRGIGQLAGRARGWFDANPERIPALRLGKIEVVSAGAVRGTISIALLLGHRVAQLAIAYVWLLAALSLFESTRGYTERLTGFVLAPLSALAGRIGGALPLLVVAGIAGLAVVVLVRFVGLFFGNVARGETKLGWLPADLATPTSVLVRGGIVVVALIVAAPLITGTDEGAFSRVGVAALVALGIAATPVLACAALGIPWVYGRRLRPGDFAEMGGRAGRVRDVGLLETTLEDPFGCILRVPHLLALVHPTRIVGRVPLVTFEVVVDATEPQPRVLEVLQAAVAVASHRAKVELVSLDRQGACYRITCSEEPGGVSVGGAVADALARENIGLGRLVP
jgi:small-conductance mechanosensitive channel